MDKNAPFLCSELVALQLHEAALVANLESIGADGCMMSSDILIAVGSPVAIQCLECPSGNRDCRTCRFEGCVRSVQASEAGVDIEVDFAGRHWTPEQWRPRHLLCLSPHQEDSLHH